MNKILDINPDEKKAPSSSYAYQSMKYFLYNLGMLGVTFFTAFFFIAFTLNSNISSNPNMMLAGEILIAMVHGVFIFFSIKGFLNFIQSIRYKETAYIAMVIGLLGNGFFLAINLVLLGDFVSDFLNF